MNAQSWQKFILVSVGALSFACAPMAFAKPAQIWAPTGALYSAGETGKPLRVNSGASFTLTGGLKVALSDIQSPKLAWPEKHYKAWPLAKEAKAFLSTLTQGKTVRLYYNGDKRDRYGRALAQVWTLDADGARDVWLQEAMVGAGFARVYGYGLGAQAAGRLFAAERRARAQTLGIWDPKKTKNFYAVRAPAPNAVAQYVDSVQIVEGIVLSAADVRGTLYLNFGSDYKTDFTIAVSKKTRKRFKNTGYNLMNLTGAKVRVRGWIELQNGPMVWLSGPDRLEVLD